MTQTNGTGTSRQGWTGWLLRTAVVGGAVGLGMAAMAAISAPQAPADDSMSMMQQHHERMQQHLDQALTEIDASDAQRQQIDTLFKDAMTAEHADMQKFHQNMGKLKTLLTAVDIDEAAVTQLRGEQDQLLLATSQRVTDTLMQAAKVLTPAQRQQLGAHIDKMMASGHHHMMAFHPMGG
ncbi:MAG: Spy/CpxP family protein refolding chaperone [Nevskia sp.]|nr:Spy/CpxP family protein refolding chaperone [Nevskia sp.]